MSGIVRLSEPYIIVNPITKEYVILPRRHPTWGGVDGERIKKMVLAWLSGEDLDDLEWDKTLLGIPPLSRYFGRWRGHSITETPVYSSADLPADMKNITDEVLSEIESNLRMLGEDELAEDVKQYRLFSFVLSTVDWEIKPEVRDPYNKYLNDLKKYCDDVDNGKCYIFYECMEDEKLCVDTIPIAPRDLFLKVFNAKKGDYDATLAELKKMGYAVPGC